MKKIETKIKPKLCPFCGNEVDVYDFNIEYLYYHFFLICRTQDCYLGTTNRTGADPEVLVQRFNNRKPAYFVK